MSPSGAEPFGDQYSGVYDALYAEKDYSGECDLLEEAFRRHGPGTVQTILDLGCGTGGHAIPMAQRGYDITGVDLSEAMLRQAQAKADAAGVKVGLELGDVRDVDLGRSFDAVIMMFAVIGYQRTNGDVQRTLKNVRRHLGQGGLFVFDAWYGPGVLSDPPGSRERAVEHGGTEVRRSVTSELDSLHHLCSVHYALSGGAKVSETHVMRFFFPLELELLLRNAGFELESISPVGGLDGQPTTDDWNVNVAATAV